MIGPSVLHGWHLQLVAGGPKAQEGTQPIKRLSRKNSHCAAVVLIITSQFQDRELLLLPNPGNQLPVPPAITGHPE